MKIRKKISCIVFDFSNLEVCLLPVVSQVARVPLANVYVTTEVPNIIVYYRINILPLTI